MTTEQFLKLQTGMYVTDKNLPVDRLVCSDFYFLGGFVSRGRIILRPLTSDGRQDTTKLPKVTHFDFFNLSHAMHASDFRNQIAIG
jgi:hypothetical protein